MQTLNVVIDMNDVIIDLITGTLLRLVTWRTSFLGLSLLDIKRPLFRHCNKVYWHNERLIKTYEV